MVSAVIRELASRLSEILPMLRRSDEAPVTDRSETAAWPHQPSHPPEVAAYPELVRRARLGKVRLGAPNRADLYPRMPRSLPAGTTSRLLDEERGKR